MTKQKLKLDKEEKEILKAVEKGEFESVPFVKSEIKRLSQIAKNTFAKTRSINIRVSERDLLRLKAKAMKEGLPYQTLISSILHKYVNGIPIL